MRVRGRLVLAFTYILVTVIVALSIPLAINLARRVRAEIEADTKVSALTIAAQIGGEGAIPGPALDRAVASYSVQVDGRVVVVDVDGIVIADSEGTSLGENFNNGLRPEIAAALDPVRPTATAITRYSATEQADLLVAAAPIQDEGLFGAIRITRNVQDVSDAIRATTVGLFVIGGAGLVAGLLIAFGLAGSFARPLSRLASAAHRIRDGDLTARAGELHGAREIEELAESFDDMAERLERTVQAQREFVANASHQLRTPLTGMKLRIENARTSTEDPDITRQLDAADLEVDRLSETVDRMLVLATRVERGDPVEMDLADCARRAVERWADRAATLDTEIRSTGIPAPALADANDVDQLVDNLIDNALAYAAGPIELETRRAGDDVTLIVRDHGPGFSGLELERVTERFYRGRGVPSGGSGLGLAIARDIAERWGGSLTVMAADGGGARIDVRLPASDRMPRSTDGSASS